LSGKIRNSLLDRRGGRGEIRVSKKRKKEMKRKSLIGQIRNRELDSFEWGKFYCSSKTRARNLKIKKRIICAVGWQYSFE